MRVIGRTEYERKRCTGGDNGPVCSGIQPAAPDIRPLYLAAIKCAIAMLNSAGSSFCGIWVGDVFGFWLRLWTSSANARNDCGTFEM
jgi:hypothetical protein